MTNATDARTNSSGDRDDALAVVRRLREAGHVAYFAGGCVRDVLLGLEPKDYDVATDAPPPRVRELFRNTQAVGAAFGVILVRQGRSQVEVATFRSDGAYEDGRRPTEVQFTTAEEDARRRDFTINGLFLDPVENRVIDYVGGREDLENKVLRAIGDPDKRFEEDHLRLLRAVRFAARFDLNIEPRTSAAIRTHAAHLKRISPERIADELRKTFAGPHGEWAWYALRDEYRGLGEAIFRFAGPPPALPTGEPDPGVFRAHDDDGTPWPFGLCLAAAALEWGMLQSGSWDVAKLLEPRAVQQTVRALRQSLRISNDEAKDLEDSLVGLAYLLREDPPTVVTLKRFLARPTAPLSRRLLGPLGCQLGPARVERLQRALAETDRSDYAPPPLITGDDLMAARLAPGPVFKRVLDAVYDAQLEGRVTTREEALRLALELGRP